MTHAVISDKFPTQDGVKQRKFDTPDSRSASAPASGVTGSSNRGTAVADVSRGHERLLQEAGQSRMTTIESLTQARASLAQLQTDIAADPDAVLRATANLNPNTFEAAIAKPSG